MKLIILDRDGVINHDSGDYIKSESEWHAIPGSLEAIADLSQNDYQVVVVSNQSGIGRGLYTTEDLNRIHQKMIAELAKYDGRIEAIFFCSHAPTDGCDCRKPKPGLFHQISERLRMSLDNVYFIGDKVSDVEVAEEVNVTPILVRTGYGESAIESGELSDDLIIYDDLASAVEAILEND